LPRAAWYIASAAGPAATIRSPDATVVTVSMMDRPICGLFLASFSK
jgi:hypothetical protein